MARESSEGVMYFAWKTWVAAIQLYEMVLETMLISELDIPIDPWDVVMMVSCSIPALATG